MIKNNFPGTIKGKNHILRIHGLFLIFDIPYLRIIFCILQAGSWYSKRLL
jgi:hypothetical protein